MVIKTKMLGLMLAAAILSLPMIAYADSGAVTPAANPSHQAGNWHHGHMMAKVLNLSDDQVKQLEDIQQKQKEAMKNVFEQMKSNREAFNTEIVKAAPDMAKVTDLQNQLKAIQGQMLDNHLNSILTIKKIMSPEQFTGYMALKKEKELKMHHGPKDGFGKGRDGHDHWGDKGKKEDEGNKD